MLIQQWGCGGSPDDHVRIQVEARANNTVECGKHTRKKESSEYILLMDVDDSCSGRAVVTKISRPSRPLIDTRLPVQQHTCKDVGLFGVFYNVTRVCTAVFTVLGCKTRVHASVLTQASPNCRKLIVLQAVYWCMVLVGGRPTIIALRHPVVGVVYRVRTVLIVDLWRREGPSRVGWTLQSGIGPTWGL